MRRSRLVGCGAYLPDRVLSNDDLALRIDTSDAWIRTRTGIGQRHVAADDELTSDLACAASGAALEAAGVRAEDLDLIVLATSIAIVNLLVDVSYRLIDPRIRAGAA